ncbi:hypothetical protein D3C86_2041560 [compost metagenome]
MDLITAVFSPRHMKLIPLGITINFRINRGMVVVSISEFIRNTPMTHSMMKANSTSPIVVL